MLPIGLQIIPHISAREIATVAIEAEKLGYTHLWLSDEGFMVDPFTALGMIAAQTRHMRLGVITNPYTRHPAMTAAAVATLDSISDGRAELCYVAGGSLVLDPINMSRPQPVQTVQEAIFITRQLLRGEKITWQGRQFSLKDAQLEVRVTSVPEIHVAARGAKMLEMAAQHADAIWTGIDAQTINTLRTAANGRPLKMICGEHPPSASDAESTIMKAVQQDGGGDVPVVEDFAAWVARIQHNAALMDSLLIVTWETSAEAMLAMLHTVKEAFA
jgi:alkanesulfonate monooxygenase SsuD/methylene tetrahydromethanopterin reductase-like flavin-dependent oxidoreductase (luciferase family)